MIKLPMTRALDPIMESKLPKRVNYFTAEEEFRTLRLRVNSSTAFFEFWNKVLSSIDRERYNNDPNNAYAQGGTVGVASRLWGVSAERATLDVARVLGCVVDSKYRWLLERIGEAANDVDTIRKRIVPAFKLVLIDGKREIYWKGQEIKIDWAKAGAEWDYVFELARCAKIGIPLNHEVFSEEFKSDYLSKKKSKLTCRPEFPNDLGDLIKPVGSNEQVLDDSLPPQQIHIFEMQPDGTVREWTGLKAI